MKNKQTNVGSFATAKLQVIIAIAMITVIGFALALATIACDDGNGNNNGGGGDTVISIKAIAGVTAPVQGETPVTAITANAQYTGTVAWSDAPATFAYATEYVATITLTAKSGYTLQGVSADFFTVAGAIAVNNAVNSGVVTAIFPQTVDDPNLSTLTGTITINPNADVTIDTELTATYSRSETVSFQWKKDGGNVGTASTTNPNKYMPTIAGSYTVTVSAAGYNPKTSAPVHVTSGGDPLHVHDWNTTYTTINAATETSNGTEAQTCKHNASHTQNSRTLYAFGTAGLVFELISINDGTDNAYRVHNGGDNTLFEAVHIPAFHREDADSPYLPVTEIGNGANTVNSNAFGGIGSSGTTPQTFTPSDPNTTLATVTFAAESQLTAIRNNAFFGCTSLDGITLPASVTSIGTQAFLGCTSLASITLPDSLESIGQLAFNKCTSLASVTIPAGVTTIDIYAFYGCTSLASITIPDSVQSIGSSAFQDCTSLASVSIGAGVTTWGLSAFAGCSSLASVTFAEGLTTIGSQAFMNCTSLTSVTFAGTIPSSGFPTNVFNNVYGGNNFRTKFYENDPDNGTPGTYIKGGDGTVGKH